MRIQGALAAALLLLAQAAHAGIDPYEPNDSFEDAAEIDFAAEQVGQIVTIDEAGISSGGDVDFFQFTNMEPGTEYEVTLDNIVLGIGIYSNSGQLLDSIAFDTDLVLYGVADVNGELVVSVCGNLNSTSVLDCSGSGQGTGPYTLIVPEPSAAGIAVAATVVVAGLARRRRA